MIETYYTPGYFAGWGTLAMINAAIAQSKNRSGLIWFLLSIPLGPFATLLLITVFSFKKN